VNLADRYNPVYSVADYQRWEGQWELIDGVAIDMGAPRMASHGAMVADLAYCFKTSFRQYKVASLEVVVAIDWIVDDSNVVRPDLAIVAKPIKEEHIHCPPFLVVEVASSSTAEKDRTVKFELYQQQGVKYYLIADPVNQQLEIFQRVDGCYHLQPPKSPFPFELEDAERLLVEFQ